MQVHTAGCVGMLISHMSGASVLAADVHLPDAGVLLPGHALDLLRGQRQVLVVLHLSSIKLDLTVLYHHDRRRSKDSSGWKSPLRLHGTSMIVQAAIGFRRACPTHQPAHSSHDASWLYTKAVRQKQTPLLRPASQFGIRAALSP